MSVYVMVRSYAARPSAISFSCCSILMRFQRRCSGIQAYRIASPCGKRNSELKTQNSKLHELLVRIVVALKGVVGVEHIERLAAAKPDPAIQHRPAIERLE